MSDRKKHEIIYKEAFPAPVSYIEDHSVVDFAEDDVREFSEDHGLEADSDTVFEKELKGLSDISLEDVLEPMKDDLGDLEKEVGDAEGVVEEIIAEFGEESALKVLLPGSNVSSEDLDDDTEEKLTDYANDKDLTKFMDHVDSLYPAKIPRHDGSSTVGCERAISFLDRLNGDISRAIREDHENVLDIAKLEDVRVNIMRDVLVLKDHLGKLKKQIRDNHGKKASGPVIPRWKTSSGKALSYSQMKEAENLEKQASTPRNIVIAVSPFERAISGMMINAHVSAGHPIEEVYASLKEKYKLTDREELSIMQLCMDSGFHIFKDRGSYSSESSDDSSKRGIDFVRNYFA